MRRAVDIARVLASGFSDAVAVGMAVSGVGCLLLLALGRIGGGLSAWVEAAAWATGAGALAGLALSPLAIAWRVAAPGFGRAEARAYLALAGLESEDALRHVEEGREAATR